MSKNGTTLKSIRKTGFDKVYIKLFTNAALSRADKLKLLKLAILFLNSNDPYLKKFGYRVIVVYSNKLEDYEPLYDVSLNLGFIPVAKMIENMPGYKEKFNTNFMNSFISSFKDNFKNGGIYQTFQQHGINSYLERETGSVAVIAPTSYGKSELIISSLKRNLGNTCILVPTKALISQTKKRIINSNNFSKDRKLITHPDMYVSGDLNIVAVLTQERLLRLLQKEEKLSFDIVYVDEAHNLLDDEKRGRLLATSLIVLNKRNSSLAVRFLTPFLVDVNNLKISHTDFYPRELRIDEYLKTEKLYCYDFNEEAGLQLYDQFLDKYMKPGVEKFNDVFSLIDSKSGHKNIIYFNKPVSIEKFVKTFIKKRSNTLSGSIKKAAKVLAEFLDKDYLLIKCLEKGVVYHHGSVPDNVKLYVENLFSTEDDIQYIVTTSTLLEGVNIPADKLFLLEIKKGQRNLSASQFKNLVGRVCRFSEIFHPEKGNLKKLEPEVYILKSDFMDKRANIDTFVQGTMKVDKKLKEVAENILLENSDNQDPVRRSERFEFEDFIENLEPGSVTTERSIEYAKTDFGKSCFLNSVDEIDVIKVESFCQKIVDELKVKGDFVKDVNGLLDLINLLFIQQVKEDPSYSNISRLREEKARKFYSIFLGWKIRNASYSEMIRSFLAYWEKVDDPLVFVGKWGDRTRLDGFLTHWTDISEKTQFERVNLAVVRVKEEQDFVDNEIVKFVEVINDLQLIDGELYQKIKYGTSDQYKILLIKSGMSSSLATLLMVKYASYITFDLQSQIVILDPSVQEAMRSNEESELLVFEVGYSIIK